MFSTEADATPPPLDRETAPCGETCCSPGASAMAYDQLMAGEAAAVQRIRDALALDRLVLYAQPIVELSSGITNRHELLLRMLPESGEDGLIPPGDFLPDAERTGLIGEIDRWVVRQAIEMLRGDIQCLEVNLSGKSLADQAMPSYIEQLLEEASVEPSKLILEITETAAIANMVEASAFANRLTAVGCRFALDDFGVAFGSLYYLKHLPVDYVKIDGEFIRELKQDPADQVIVRAIVELAHGLGIGTIAEFVIDEATARILAHYGVDYAQGDHFGRPRPVSEIGAEASAR
jgi:EAL domain-containing protein (putative c-di-GMP-specific phosphodiesterase class I)